MTAIELQNETNPSLSMPAERNTPYGGRRQEDETPAQRKAAADDRARLIGLARLARITGRGGSPGALLDHALEVLRDLLPVDFISVAVSGPGPDEIELIAGSRDGEPFPLAVIKRRDRGLTESVMAGGRTAVIPDLRSTEYAVRWMREGRSRAYVGVPLEEEGFPYGVLSVQSERVEAFGDDDGDLLELVEVRQEDPKAGADTLDLLEETLRVVTGLEDGARERGVEIRLVGSSVMARLPASWMTRIMENLLGNALKYTPRGGQVSVEVDSDERWASLKVSDTGIGFDSGEAGRLFEPFVRLTGDERVKAESGTGLGLSIAREMVERAGGKIAATSAGRDSGAVFEVRLPRAAHETRAGG